MDKLKHPIDLDHITSEQATQATIEMWSDMMVALGENPDLSSRNKFKKNWLTMNGYESIYPGMTLVLSDCFLCERSSISWHKAGYSLSRCEYCPLYWPADSAVRMVKCAGSYIDYRLSPLPDILAYIQDEKNRRIKK